MSYSETPHLEQQKYAFRPNQRQHPTVVNAMSCNLTDNIVVTMKCVRKKMLRIDNSARP